MTGSGLTFRRLTAADEPALLDAWLVSVQRGFHDRRPSEETRTMWHEHIAADAAVLTGAWLDRPSFGAERHPVATFASFDKTINTGAGTLPLHMITDVTVAPTHRRQGLLRRLMTDDLTDAAARGLPLAALTVSEGSIYGRFGFGMATFTRKVEVDTTARFRLRDEEAARAAGTTVLVEPADAWPAITTVYDAFQARTRGSVERPRFYEDTLTGRYNPADGGPDHLLRVAVHLDVSGRPDGYVAYRPESEEVTGRHRVRIRDLVATGPAPYFALWRYLADIDLIEQAVWHRAPSEDPLPHALVEPFAVKSTLDDLLWVRVLDVPTALEARPWGAEDSLVIAVEDPLGHAEGHWELTTSGGAKVVRTEAAPDLRMAADTLGALYLGGVAVGTLAAAGRIRGAAEVVQRFAAMADPGPAPYCITGF
ncbi:GNAT family N-acetyltransferase [Nocardioides insulae]|uniref:GNAT family N-acetyltransferase n=1 Tax=Nocardioides insulae TaxID=394734 RepID=UPI00040C891D|nr:GNAT family N-acetyltransferase [Nocardioides insulae]